MTDVAAGGQAALQLQQTMAAAPYVQEQVDAAAEQTQLKLQQDRLKNSYAPQEAALKLAQDQENLTKTRFANTVQEINLKEDKTFKDIIQNLYKDPEFKKLEPSDQQRRLGADLQAQGLAEQGAKAIAQADVSDLKKMTTELKKHETDRLELNKTLAYLAGADDEQIKELVLNMPQAMKDNVDKQLPNWSKQTDPKLQKAQLEALTQNGSGRNSLGEHQKRLEILDQQIKIRELQVQQQEAMLKNRQYRGSGNNEDSKREDAQYKQARRDAVKIDSEYRKDIKEAEDVWKKAYEQDSKKTYGLTSWFGGGPSLIKQTEDKPDEKAELTSSKAWNELQRLKKEVVQKKLNVLEGMPETKEKDKLFNLYQKELLLLDTSVPGEKKLIPINVEDKDVPPPAKDKSKGGMPVGAKTHDGYPARKNSDGSYSTELSITVTNPKLNGGKPTNIPSLWKGKEVDEETAVKNALTSGTKYESFSTIPEAVSAAKEKSKSGGAATSNKPVAPKFEEGKVYTDAKGNKAKYVNGKWEPQ